MLARCAADEPVPRLTGSFDDDPSDLLELLAHRGIIAAVRRPLGVLEPMKTSSRSASFQLNQGLFDSSGG